ncbi:hypothetical protein D3C87_2131350 [compost metagenome]
MPMLGVGRAFYRIPFSKYLNRLPFFLIVTDPVDRNQSLPAWVLMPVRPRAWLEGYAGNRDIKRTIRLYQ